LSYFVFLGVPSNIRLADVRKDLTNIDHVRSVHNVHVWALTAGKTVLSAHVVVGMLTSFTLRKMMSLKSKPPSPNVQRAHITNVGLMCMGLSDSSRATKVFKLVCSLLLSVSTDPRADVNSLLLEATQKMTETYHFYKSCLQVEFNQTELNKPHFHLNNAATTTN